MNCLHLTPIRLIQRTDGQIFVKDAWECGHANARPTLNRWAQQVVRNGPDHVGCVPADSLFNIGVKACGPGRGCYVAPDAEDSA